MPGIQSLPLEHDPSVLPELSPTPFPIYGDHNDKYPVQTTAFDQQETGCFELSGNEDEDDKKAIVATVTLLKTDRRICGLRKNIFIGFIISILLLITIAGVVAGGVVATRNNSQTSVPAREGQEEQIPSPSPSPNGDIIATNTSNAVVAAATAEPMRSIVATQSNGSMFNVWQKANGDLWMHAYYQNKANAVKGTVRWTDPAKLETTMSAINNTPIAAAAWLVDDSFEIHIHYTTQSQDMLTSLIVRCAQNGTLCDTPRTVSISGSTALSAGTGSFMIALAVNVMRQYSVNSDGIVSESVYDPKTSTWATPRPINAAAKAHKSSPVAAGLVNGEIWLFWFDETKRLKMATSIWKSETWSQINSISTHTVPITLPRTLGLATTTTDSGSTLQLFFYDGANMQQVRYSKKKWTTGDLSASVPEPSVPNGPFGAVGWNETQVRMYVPTGEERKIKEVSGSEEKWKYGSGWMDGYD